MCRWLAYSGSPIPLDELIFNTDHSLIDQSMSAKLSPKPTNGDGFGVGWYGRKNQPGVYHSVQPAWNDANLRDLAFQVESPLFLAHVRRSTGTPVQQSNCHPFRHNNWLFVHNGLLRDFHLYRRDMVLAVAPELFPKLRGSTDSELMFFIALTLGLENEPLPALERMAGLVESFAAKHGVHNPIQMTLGVADGETLFAVRYSSEGKSRTLYHSESIKALLKLFPDHAKAQVFPEDARAVVSEPLGDKAEAWVPIPESTALIIKDGEVDMQPFTPREP
jgi:predicted glutamine amidotransferase